MSNQCEHGQLARVCSTCEFEREIEALQTELTLEREHTARLEYRLELQQEAANRHSAKVEELDRLNTGLAMESHALQARVAELEALVRDIEYGKTPGCACRIMQPITRTEAEWIAEAERLCPPTPQEDA